ncbi:MAG: NAD-dependent DNA ligase LigA [Lachnospiraceae bacterium]|nr:NAD-dependent DNA ligase LigA [Lachnospiraceae bacterium]
MEEKKKRIRELTEFLNRAARAYEQEDRELISNYEYDRLYDELKQLEEETGIVMSDSPTMRAGYEVLSELPKVQHDSPMLSLDKTKEVAALQEWLGEKEGLLSWKLDGLTIVLTYRNGALVQAVTRGNGETGELVTNNAKVFKNVPLSIPFRGELVLRGEAVIKYSDFEKINAEIEDVDARYKNPRNLCSGSVRQLNNEITAKRNVNFFAFSLVTAEGAEFATRSAQMHWLTEQGFEVVESKAVTAENLPEIVDYFSKKITENDFPSDGLVLTFDDIAYGEALGRTAKFPRHSIAFKWQDEIRETTLLEVEWSPSRTGLINPVAIFEPVELEGTSVARASLHNISIMEALELGIGDRITVYKANMIIPQLADNLTRSGMCPVPEACPVCGKGTRIKDENGVKTLHCVNAECPVKKIKQFTHFVSRDALNIEGLSEATLEKLIDERMLCELADLFHLEQYKERIVQMEGFGEKSYQNLTNSIEKAREVEVAKFVYSLGILNVGLANAKLICRQFDNDIARVRTATTEELTQIPGIGTVIAESIVDFFAKPENIAKVDALLAELRLQAEENVAESKLAGKTFVITGSVEQFANRNELKDYIEKRGGKVTGSVTAKTDYLINNDNMSNSTKNKKAKELGIPIITETEFLALEEA